MFPIWTLVIGLVMLGLASPAIYAIFSAVSPSFSDVADQAILAIALPAVFFLFVLVLFLAYRSGGDGF